MKTKNSRRKPISPEELSGDGNPRVQIQRKNNGKQVGGITGKGFMPGQSGNPGGRPKGSVKISTAYERSLARLVPGDPEGRTYAQMIADKNVELAAQGNIAAIKEVTDRVEGKAPRTVEISRYDFRRGRWARLVDQLSEKYGKSREQVIEDLIEREPSAAEWLM